jgi:hypothetical protein
MGEMILQRIFDIEGCTATFINPDEILSVTPAFT